MLAAQIRAGQLSLFAQEVRQVRARLDLDTQRLAIDVQLDTAHAAGLFIAEAAASARASAVACIWYSYVPGLSPAA